MLTSPWEAQYAQVSREMTATGDYIYPTYRNVGFFSKPVLTMWLTAPGLSLTGGWMSDGVHSEWMPFAVRLPFALLLLLLAWSCHWAVNNGTDNSALAPWFLSPVLLSFWRAVRLSPTCLSWRCMALHSFFSLAIFSGRRHRRRTTMARSTAKLHWLWRALRDLHLNSRSGCSYQALIPGCGY